MDFCVIACQSFLICSRDPDNKLFVEESDRGALVTRSSTIRQATAETSRGKVAVIANTIWLLNCWSNQPLK